MNYSFSINKTNYGVRSANVNSGNYFFHCYLF